MSHPIENIVAVTMENLRQLIDVNTVIGRPIAVGNGTVLLPVSRVSLGFLTGGGEYSVKSPIKRCGLETEKSGSEYPFAGSSAAGIAVTPTAFLTVHDGRVSVSAAQCDTVIDRLVELIPQITQDVEALVKGLVSCKEKE